MSERKGYRVVREDYQNALEDEVNRLMRRGWVPLGSVAVYTTFTGVVWLQSMIRRENNE